MTWTLADSRETGPGCNSTCGLPSVPPPPALRMNGIHRGSDIKSESGKCVKPGERKHKIWVSARPFLCHQPAGSRTEMIPMTLSWWVLRVWEIFFIIIFSSPGWGRKVVLYTLLWESCPFWCKKRHFPNSEILLINSYSTIIPTSHWGREWNLNWFCERHLCHGVLFGPELALWRTFWLLIGSIFILNATSVSRPC